LCGREIDTVDWEDDEPAFYQEAGDGRASRIARILGASVPIVRAGGIVFRLHWTFPLAALAFAGWTARSGHGAAFHVLFAWGLTQAAILYTLVLLHEIGHAAAGRMKGRPAREIVLTPLGGQAVIDRAMATPAMEAEVTLAGPGVNLVFLALSMAVVALAGLGMPSAGGPPFTLGALLGFAFWANLMLAVFNLVPAFPMDGGRVLRALLAWRKGGRRGTVIAARVGEGFGVAFVILGVWKGAPYGWVLASIGAWNFIACEHTVRAVAQGYDVYEEYVPAVNVNAESPPRETREERAAREREEIERRVDELLAKVSREGMGSLSSGEKRFLRKASRKYRDAKR
jgi:Zn-dependent protease